MAAEKSAFEIHMAKLKVEYASQLPQKLEAIANDWKSLQAQWNPETITLLHRNVHSLIGTSGTFGFTDLSKSARELETTLKPLIENKDPDFITDATLTANVQKGLHELFSILNTIQKTDSTKEDEKKAEDLAVKIAAQKKPTIHTEDALVYYLDDEHTGSSLLTQHLSSYGFKASHFRTMAQLYEAVSNIKPSLVMLDLMIPNTSEEEVFEYAQKLSAQNIKVFILSAKDNFESRLKGVRAGAHAYLVKPADIPSLITLIRSNLHLNSNKPSHILIVDDQESAANFYSNVLTTAGMQVTVETDPRKALEQLEKNTPDLIILDLNMPHVSGDELAAIIRQQEQYQTIPILFLSGSAKPELKTSLLEIGSDDLLSKGMAPDELVRQVNSRVERAKILTSMMFQDSLTGLLNHAQIQLAAERVFNLSTRKESVNCVAMIDIDKFKAVNDTYGHLTGDRVLKALAQLFQQRLRFTDYIGRFGGEEFMLVLPNININDAGNLINNLRKAFAAMEFKEGDACFHVSFSAGISENSGMNTYIEQIKFADEALYRAKARGRNIICASLAGEQH